MRAWGLGFGAYGLGFRGLRFRFGVWGLRLKALRQQTDSGGSPKRAPSRKGPIAKH